MEPRLFKTLLMCRSNFQSHWVIRVLLMALYTSKKAMLLKIRLKTTSCQQATQELIFSTRLTAPLLAQTQARSTASRSTSFRSFSMLLAQSWRITLSCLCTLALTISTQWSRSRSLLNICLIQTNPIISIWIILFKSVWESPWLAKRLLFAQSESESSYIFYKTISLIK